MRHITFPNLSFPAVIRGLYPVCYSQASRRSGHMTNPYREAPSAPTARANRAAHGAAEAPRSGSRPGRGLYPPMIGAPQLVRSA